MGWDIVAVGTNHNLDIDNPESVAERMAKLCPGPLSVGYYDDVRWVEQFRVNPNSEGIITIMSIERLSRPDWDFALYEMDNEKYLPNNRIFKEMVDFSFNYIGRWGHFHDLFCKPYEGKNKEVLDVFRSEIYNHPRYIIR